VVFNTLFLVALGLLKIIHITIEDLIHVSSCDVLWGYIKLIQTFLAKKELINVRAYCCVYLRMLVENYK